MYPEQGQVKRIPVLKKKRKRKANLFLLIVLFLFFISVLILLFLKSPFSKVSDILVEGNLLLSRQEVIDHSGIKIGDSIFQVISGSVIERLTKLPEISEAKVEKKFPGKLIISVKEYSVISFWLENGKLYPITSNGKILTHREWKSQFVNDPIITQWDDKSKLPELAKELSNLPSYLRERISDIHLEPTPSYPDRIHFYTLSGYEVYSTISGFAKKFELYPQILKKIESKDQDRSYGIIYLLDGTWYRTYETNSEANMSE
ncbi:FtsQ-type POTRA domain-containing protein [Microaerobacter geothermalis]|uniref:cell division protein FtsQ/DivIB n=1 Tax=Microaerobacter geothermalis TaxID=674972 RepID=UPI001F3E71E0|nr:FtsQ-type POTRA domain-containing protein [Microaerobacter geothermalis]MCF6093608.1 FtsQ-type POTRA domain-containing protein [Microaerobacter geothermalis]